MKMLQGSARFRSAVVDLCVQVDFIAVSSVR
jgi:hypothetical protein